LPADFTASPAARAADLSPPAAPFAARLACSALAAAWLPCRLAADFVPRELDSSRTRLRSRVAAPFLAASWRSAFVWGIVAPRLRVTYT
jgi:hypothetical protein